MKWSLPDSLEQNRQQMKVRFLNEVTTSKGKQTSCLRLHVFLDHLDKYGLIPIGDTQTERRKAATYTMNT